MSHKSKISDQLDMRAFYHATKAKSSRIFVVTLFLIITMLVALILVPHPLSTGRSEPIHLAAEKDLLVLQSDNRPLTAVDYATNVFDMDFWSASALVLSYWCRKYGYTYRRVDAPQMFNLHETWWRLQPMRDALEQGFNYVVFLDSDAFIARLDLSFEDLRHRWNMTDDISFLIGEDDEDFVDSETGKQIRMANGGFWILKNDLKCRQMLDILIGCTRQIVGCSKWAFEPFHEQSAFNEFVRSKYQYGIDWIMAPCNDVYGGPNLHYSCTGKVIRHMAGPSKHHLPKMINAALLTDIYSGLSANLR